MKPVYIYTATSWTLQGMGRILFPWTVLYVCTFCPVMLSFGRDNCQGKPTARRSSSSSSSSKAGVQAQHDMTTNQRCSSTAAVRLRLILKTEIQRNWGFSRKNNDSLIPLWSFSSLVLTLTPWAAHFTTVFSIAYLSQEFLPSCESEFYCSSCAL